MRWTRWTGIVTRRALNIILAAVGAAATVHAAEVTISNGVTGEGALTVTTDDYGSFGTALDWPDLFDMGPLAEPPGEHPLTNVTNLFVFVDPSDIGQGTHRGVLSTHPLLLNFFAGGNLVGDVTAANVLLDPQTAASAYTVQGDGVDLRWTLTQQVSALSAGASFAMIEQTYAFTNHGDSAMEFIIVKHLDDGLPLNSGGPFSLGNLVGVDFSELGRAQVYAQDRESSAAAMVLRTREDMQLDPRTVDFVYYAGVQGLPPPPGNSDFPGGDCPAFGAGLDTQLWDHYGVPNCWKNFIPGVGYNVPGSSPFAVDGDAFIGLQVEVALPVGDTYEVTFVTRYGSRPAPITQVPPQLTVQTIDYDQATGCAEFLWRFKNVNPIVPGTEPVMIDEFYLDVEAGSGGKVCSDVTPPEGWSVTLCDGFDAHGHALYKFFGGEPIPLDDHVVGRLRVDTNALMEATNPETGVTVPPLSMVLHVAQQQEDAECNFNFGPSGHGSWSVRAIATAHLPVPALTTWARVVLAMLMAWSGTLLLLRTPAAARNQQYRR